MQSLLLLICIVTLSNLTHALCCNLQAIVAALLMNIYIVGLNQISDIEIDKVGFQMYMKPCLLYVKYFFFLSLKLPILKFDLTKENERIRGYLGSRVFTV